MLRQLTPYVRGILFCLLATAAIGGVIGSILAVPFLGSSSALFVFVGAALVVEEFGIAIGISAWIGVWVALRAAKNGASFGTVEKKTCRLGALCGGIAGLIAEPINRILKPPIDPFLYALDFGVLWRAVLEESFYWPQAIIAIFGVIFGAIIGRCLPSVLGADFKAGFAAPNHSTSNSSAA